MTVKRSYQSTLKTFLKRIVCAPLMILMGAGGVDGGEGEGHEDNVDTLREIAGDGPTLSERLMQFAGNPHAQHMQIPNAAAGKDEEDDADRSGEEEDADEDGDGDGLDTEGSDESGSDADQDEADDEEQDEEGEETHKGIKQRKLDQRIEELVEKRLAEREKAAAAEKPDWVDITQDQVDASVAEMEAQIDELRMEGKYSEARKLSRKIDQLEADFEENEKRRKAWESRQQGKKVQESGIEHARIELDESAELYRTELKIDKTAWDKMGEWFTGQMETSKVLAKEFNDVYNKNGAVAAIRFAHQHAVQHMGKKTKAANEKREQNKQKSAAVTNARGGNLGPVDVRKAKAAFDADPSPDNFASLQAAKRAAGGAKR